MLVSDIQRRVQNIFGDTASVQITLPNIVDWVNDGQKDICRKAECLETTVTPTLTGGTPTYAYPADFIKERVVKVNGLKLCRLTLASIDVLYPDRDSSPASGNPLYYYHWGRALNFYPTPSSNMPLTLMYVQYAALIAAGGDTPAIPDLFHEDIVRYCFWHALEQDEQWTAAQVAKQVYDERLMQTIYDCNVRESETYPSVQLCAGDY